MQIIWPYISIFTRQPVSSPSVSPPNLYDGTGSSHPLDRLRNAELGYYRNIQVRPLVVLFLVAVPVIHVGNGGHFGSRPASLILLLHEICVTSIVSCISLHRSCSRLRIVGTARRRILIISASRVINTREC